MVCKPPIVIYDACVLYPFHLRNLLIQIAVEGLVIARWTDAIHEEWIRALVANGRVSRHRLLRTCRLMNAALPNANVFNYEHLTTELHLPDSNDCHVLAAAIAAGASSIVTWNVGHFPKHATQLHGVTAINPDSFLSNLHEHAPDQVMETIEAARRNLRKTTPSQEGFMEALQRQGLTTLVRRLRGTDI
jgi:hypothetical protein